MKKTIARLITLILTAALLITFVAVTPVNAATTPKSAATKDEETTDYKEALKDLKAGIKARNKILIDDGTLSEAFKAEYEAVADYEEAKYGGGPLLDFLANSCVVSLKQITSAADLSDLEEEEQKELQPFIESEIRTYLTIVDILEKKFDVEIDDFELPEEEKKDQKKTSGKKDSTGQLQPLEIKDSGWTLVNNEWLYYYVSLYNPNEETVINYPSFRVTARDEDGVLLGTHDQVLSVIYPQQEFVFGSQAFKVDDKPEIVKFEALEPADYGLKTIDTVEPFEPFEVINTGIRSDKIVGEIVNPNETDFSSVVLVAVCKDAEGNIISIQNTYANELKAGSTVPFEIRVRTDSEIADFEVYANQW